MPHLNGVVPSSGSYGLHAAARPSAQRTEAKVRVGRSMVASESQGGGAADEAISDDRRRDHRVEARRRCRRGLVLLGRLDLLVPEVRGEPGDGDAGAEEDAADRLVALTDLL